MEQSLIESIILGEDIQLLDHEEYEWLNFEDGDGSFDVHLIYDDGIVTIDTGEHAPEIVLDGLDPVEAYQMFLDIKKFFDTASKIDPDFDYLYYNILDSYGFNIDEM